MLCYSSRVLQTRLVQRAHAVWLSRFICLLLAEFNIIKSMIGTKGNGKNKSLLLYEIKNYTKSIIIYSNFDVRIVYAA